jgi:rubredoxin
MQIKKVCPDCGATHAIVDAKGRWAERAGSDELTICCPACHAARKAKLIAREALYPSAESLGLLGSITEIPTERYRRPHQSGRQVFHKSEHRAG